MQTPSIRAMTAHRMFEGEMRSIGWMILAVLLGCGDDKCPEGSQATVPGVCHVPGEVAGKGSVDGSQETPSGPVAGAWNRTAERDGGVGGEDAGHDAIALDGSVRDSWSGRGGGGQGGSGGAEPSPAVHDMAGVRGGMGGGGAGIVPVEEAGKASIAGASGQAVGGAGAVGTTTQPAGMPAPPPPMPRCGDNHVDPGEACDGNCPVCSKPSACMTSTQTGSAATCDLRCGATPVTSCAGGDGCCPAGCNHSTDSDCSAKCGDGNLDPGEECEAGSSKPCPASCNDGDPCTDDGSTGSAATCSLKCTHSHVANPPAEVCDGKDNDCNGVIDDNVGTFWFPDCDHDGYAPQSTGTMFCAWPADKDGCGWTSTQPIAGAADCDDHDNFRNPNPDQTFGLPIDLSKPGSGLPPAGDWRFDLDCNGKQEATTERAWVGTWTGTRLDIIPTCDVLPNCAQTAGPGCITGFSFLGNLVCGQPYSVQTACSGNVDVYFLCK